MKLFTLCFLVSINALANIGSFTLDSEKTLYIVDGDSVSMQMRIAGIDTPEIKQKCRKTKFKTIDCGRLSKDYLKQVLQKVLIITIVFWSKYTRAISILASSWWRREWLFLIRILTDKKRI